MLASILCLSMALYHEARSEPLKGIVAVGTIIMNRVASPAYPDTVCDVIYQGGIGIDGCQFSFYCDGRHERPTDKRAWLLSLDIAVSVLEGARVVELEDSLWYFRTDIIGANNVSWSKEMRRVDIGDHSFFIDDYA